MSDETPFVLTSEPEVEQLLRDSVVPDVFGSPPPNLVHDSLAAIDKPCAERRSFVQPQRSTAVPLLVLVAAGMLLTTLPGAYSRFHTYEALRSSLPAAERQLTVNKPLAAPLLALGVRPAKREPVRITAALPASSFVPRAQSEPSGGAAEPASISQSRPQRRHRTETVAIRPTPPKAIWIKTVVRTSEDGVVLPVGSTSSGGDNTPDQLSASGVAVVLLHSTTTYSDYTGGSPEAN